MENFPTSSTFHCPHCAHQLVLTLPSNEPVTGPCPVCANLITFAPESAQLDPQKIPQADLEPAIEAPILLGSPRKQFRRGKFAGSRRSNRRWFKSEIDTPVSPDGTPLVIKRRRKAAFVRPDRLADRLERLSESASQGG